MFYSVSLGVLGKLVSAYILGKHKHLLPRCDMKLHYMCAFMYINACVGTCIHAFMLCCDTYHMHVGVSKIEGLGSTSRDFIFFDPSLGFPETPRLFHCTTRLSHRGWHIPSASIHHYSAR
jgi:hypothetical protein